VCLKFERVESLVGNMKHGAKFLEKSLFGFTYKKCSELSLKTIAVHQYSKTSFLVLIKFITEDSEQTHNQILILN
jgi:hypothetical protein